MVVPHARLCDPARAHDDNADIADVKLNVLAATQTPAHRGAAPRILSLYGTTPHLAYYDATTYCGIAAADCGTRCRYLLPRVPSLPFRLRVTYWRCCRYLTCMVTNRISVGGGQRIFG